MANIFNVAKYILERQGQISTWKLQKLCYYSQAWSLAWTENPLFNEDFEAWANGPVCPELFRQHRGQYMIVSSDIPESLCDSGGLTADQQDTINHVLEHYGNWEPYELREQSHSEAPWKNARGNLPSDAICNTVITKASMGTYYGGL